jgi:hypothetical protein
MTAQRQKRYEIVITREGVRGAVVEMAIGTSLPPKNDSM